MQKKTILLLLTVGWMIVIFSFSAQNAHQSGSVSISLTEKLVRFFLKNPSADLIGIAEVIIRKLAHFGIYTILGALVYLLLGEYNISRGHIFLTVAVCCLYAVSDEIHQYFVPGRACRVLDICIDTTGSFFGCSFIVGILYIKMRYFNSKKNHRQ